MVPLPLEDDGEEDDGDGLQDDSPSSSRSHPHILARRFLDFGAHSTQRFLQQDADAASPCKAQRYDQNRRSCLDPSNMAALTQTCLFRPRRASFGSREAMRGDSVTHQLSKKLQHLKKKIKQFEEQFEKERNYKVALASLRLGSVIPRVTFPLR